MSVYACDNLSEDVISPEHLSTFFSSTSMTPLLQEQSYLFLKLQNVTLIWQNLPLYDWIWQNYDLFGSTYDWICQKKEDIS